MNKDLISIIICVYNVEKYLSKCIDSVLCQSYDNLQIILIDDGSNDNSGSICDYYKKIDKRIEVVHQENKGVSTTRNVGLKMVKGKYFSFIDSDDFIDNNFIMEMYEELIKSKSDLVFCDIMQINTLTGKNYVYKKNTNSFSTRKREEILGLLFKESIIINPINKLYKTSLFDDLEYPKNIIHEDTYLIVDLLNKCRCVSYLNKPLYFRVIHNNSIMTSKTNNRKQEIDSYTHWLDIFSNDIIFYNLTIIRILNSIINNYSYLYTNLNKEDRIDMKNKFDFYKKLYTNKLSFKYKIKFWLFKYFDLLFVFYKRKGVLSK